MDLDDGKEAKFSFILQANIWPLGQQSGERQPFKAFVPLISEATGWKITQEGKKKLFSSGRGVGLLIVKRFLAVDLGNAARNTMI